MGVLHPLQRNFMNVCMYAIITKRHVSIMFIHHCFIIKLVRICYSSRQSNVLLLWCMPLFNDRKERHPSCYTGYVRVKGSMLQAYRIPKAGIRNPTLAEMSYGTHSNTQQTYTVSVIMLMMRHRLLWHRGLQLIDPALCKQQICIYSKNQTSTYIQQSLMRAWYRIAILCICSRSTWKFPSSFLHVDGKASELITKKSPSNAAKSVFVNMWLLHHLAFIYTNLNSHLNSLRILFIFVHYRRPWMYDMLITWTLTLHFMSHTSNDSKHKGNACTFR